jgi:nucleoside-diphosphate-sugar epimerase
MINELKNDRPISLYDGGMCYRDYMYVDDVVDAINTVIEKGEKNEIYNIGRGIPIYLCDTIDYAVNKIGSKSSIENIPPAPFHTKVQATNMVLNVDKLNNLGFKPKYSMEDMVDILCK